MGKEKETGTSEHIGYSYTIPIAKFLMDQLVQLSVIVDGKDAICEDPVVVEVRYPSTMVPECR